MIANISMAFPGLFHITDFQRMDIREIFQWYIMAVKQLTRHAYQQSIIAKLAFADQEYAETASEQITKLAWLTSDEADAEPEQAKHQTKEEYLQRIAMIRAHTVGAGKFIK